MRALRAPFEPMRPIPIPKCGVSLARAYAGNTALDSGSLQAQRIFRHRLRWSCSNFIPVLDKSCTRVQERPP